MPKKILFLTFLSIPSLFSSTQKNDTKDLELKLNKEIDNLKLSSYSEKYVDHIITENSEMTSELNNIKKEWESNKRKMKGLIYLELFIIIGLLLHENYIWFLKNPEKDEKNRSYR